MIRIISYSNVSGFRNISEKSQLTIIFAGIHLIFTSYLVAEFLPDCGIRQMCLLIV